MKEQNEKILTEKFPKLFKGMFEERVKKNNNEPFRPIAFGFECGDGWYTLIHDLSEKLETLINKLPEEEQKHIYAVQVKEKFGTLRFYMSGATDEMYDLINKAEEASYNICETCSKPSIVIGESWLVNQCKGCYIKYAKDRYGQTRDDAESTWVETNRKIKKREAALERLKRMKGEK